MKKGFRNKRSSPSENVDCCSLRGEFVAADKLGGQIRRMNEGGAKLIN
jgi:hypothetical protein